MGAFFNFSNVLYMVANSHQFDIYIYIYIYIYEINYGLKRSTYMKTYLSLRISQ